MLTLVGGGRLHKTELSMPTIDEIYKLTLIYNLFYMAVR